MKLLAKDSKTDFTMYDCRHVYMYVYMYSIYETQ